MPPHTLLVLENPAARHLVLLDRLPDDTRIAVASSAAGVENAAAEADVLMVGGVSRDVVEQVWRMAPRLKWVHSMWAGLDTLVFPALMESGVALTNGSGVFSRSLAEFAIAGMLWFAKDIRRMRRQQRERRWAKFTVTELRGKRLGVVGLGSIGQATAGLAAAFGMEVRGIGRNHSRLELEDLLSTSDYLLIAAPLTAATRGMLGEAELRMMKPEAVLLNLGRGPVVVERALIEALSQGWIRGAVLDVHHQEPLPESHPLWSLDNVLLSPHCADVTSTWLNEAMELFVQNFHRYTRGEELLNLVDKRLGY
ncbi:MAG: D-2-hydroxyacid dehydrogenase [Acidobacteria bacterium]|nr:D-2-hydroxyacid dehydrogenase [Acidobacteriota bacterium]